MSIHFKVVPLSNNSRCLLFHPNQYKILNETKEMATTICFGLKEMDVTYEQSKMLKEDEIGIPNMIIDYLKLPLGVDYEISIQKGAIIIGPFIGILIAKSHAKIKGKLKKIKRINEQYPLVRGVIVAFSWQGINQNNSTIKGYLYNPASEKWEEGTFPLPAVIVKRMVLSSKRKTFLKNLYGARFFNSGSIDKWKMHQILSESEDVLPYLPKTFIYKNPEDILNYLKRYRTIYVKPIFGLKGKGIVKMMTGPNLYCIKYRFKQKNKTIKLSTEKELLNYVEKNFRKNRYIIQEGIDSELVKGRIIDFRIFLVKNQTGQWEDVGIIARKGSKGSIVSNLSNGGRVDNVIKLMSASFKISEEQVLCILEEMSLISIKAARVIDKYENIFRLGVDIAIDSQQHIYLLELNHRSPAYKNSFPKVAVTKINNSRLDYAKYLAGFPINI